MTMDEVRNSTEEVLSPRDIAPILHVHPYTINVKAKEGTLEFKTYFSGNRCKVVRKSFLRYMEENGDE